MTRRVPRASLDAWLREVERLLEPDKRADTADATGGQEARPRQDAA